MVILNFGRYKNRELSVVPDDYLEFIVKQSWFPAVDLKLRKAICARLNIALIERENPYRKNYGEIAKRKSILDKNFERTVDFDDYKDSKK